MNSEESDEGGDHPTPAARPRPNLDDEPGWQQLLSFFAPLAGNPFLVFGIHSLIDAGIARMARPQTALAAFAVAKNATFFFNSPAFVLRHAAVSLIEDEDSYRRFRMIAGFMVAVLTGALLAVAFVEPLGRLLLTGVLGLEEEPVLSQALLALRVLALMPVTEYLRNLPQGVAISIRRTILIPAATVMRLAFIGVLLFLLVHVGGPAGALAAAIVLIGGMFFEAGIIVLALRREYPSVAHATAEIPSRSSGPLTTGAFWSFFVPLALMSLLSVFVPNVINAGLARTGVAEVALAGFAVAYGLHRVIAAPVTMLHQCPLVMASGRNQQASRQIFYFCMAMGLFFAALLALVAFSPLIAWVLQIPMGIPSAVAAAAAGAFGMLVPLPLVIAWKEYHWGVFMRRRDTMIMAIAKALNVATVTAISFLAIQQGSNPAAVGAMAVLGGECVEAVAVWFVSTKSSTGT